MQGFSEEKLLELCSEKYVHNGYARWNFWTAENYSFGKYIRKYANYPWVLPLNIYTDHGAGCLNDNPAPHELEAGAFCQFYHNPFLAKKWSEFSQKPCYVLRSPFVFCREVNKIQKSPDAKGTLAFSAHSTPNIDDLSNLDDYVKDLKALPEEMQPVSVCLHMHDINKGHHKVFLKHGIPVYTAGHVCDYRFAERFYGILKNFKYATSNMIGSYTYYAVEMGIPFSIYGDKPVFENSKDPNTAQGKIDFCDHSQNYKEVYDLFNGIFTEITTEQKALVERDLGLKDGLSRKELNKVLRQAYFAQGKLFTDLFYPFIKYSKRPRVLFKQIEYELFKRLY